MTGRSLRLAVLYCFVCSAARATDLETIRAELTEYYTSIASVRIAYRVESQASLDSEIVKSGESIRVITRSPEVGTSWESFDGKIGYQVIFDPTNVDLIKSIRKETSRPMLVTTHPSPLWWWGLTMNGTGLPLSEMLDRATILGESSQNGGTLIDVDLGDWPLVGGTKAHYTCTLSSMHGYLPASLTITYTYPSLDTSESVLTVDEFRDVAHPLLHKAVPVPWLMSYTGLRVAVKEVALNPEANRSLFVPQPTVGTIIVDETATGGPRRTIHQADKVRQQTLNSLRTSTVAESIPPGSPIIATPDSGLLFSLRSVLVVLVCFALLFVAWKQFASR